MNGPENTGRPALLQGAKKKPVRVGLSKRVRFEVFKRDGFVCQYCGAHPPSVTLHVDHIIAVASGGTNDVDNLVTACEPCNLGKGARALAVHPESLAEKYARVAEAEEQLAGYSAIMRAKRDRIERDCWLVVKALTGDDEIRRDRLRSIKVFVERLGVDDTIGAAEIARNSRVIGERKVFLYFCAVCWRWIKEGVQ